MGSLFLIRDLNYTFSFLEEGSAYLTQIYADREIIDWDSNLRSFEFPEMEVNSITQLNIKLVEGNGQIIQFIRRLIKSTF